MFNKRKAENVSFHFSGCITRVENYCCKYPQDSKGNYASSDGHLDYVPCITIIGKAAGLCLTLVSVNLSIVAYGNRNYIFLLLMQVAGRSLGELVRKLGERVLPLIIPILSQGLSDPDSSRRQVRIVSGIGIFLSS